MKNRAAHTAVKRDRKFALPVAPNRLPDAPLPNDAPMSAPLPCWINTRPIITTADRICTISTILVSSCMRRKAPGISAGGTADGDEVVGFQRCAADQAAVDVGLREQRERV